MSWFILSNVLLGYLRAFVGIIDDYFEGYYTEEMIESQVMIKLLSFPIYFFLKRKYSLSCFRSHVSFNVSGGPTYF